MKIGITSQNFRTITGHAGKSRRFLIFAPDGQGGVQEVERLDLPKAMSLHEFRGLDHPLYQLDALLTAGCGQGFVQRMAAQGVRVVATSEQDPTRAAADYLAGRPLPAPLPNSHSHARVTLIG
jgi:predicted Fe-Mo cluster-binding NifX family protein